MFPCACIGMFPCACIGIFSVAISHAVYCFSPPSLIDQQKSSSGDSIVSASPSTITNITRSKKAKGAKGLLKKTLLKGGDTSLVKKEEETLVLETEGYMNCVSALLKLIQVSSSAGACASLGIGSVIIAFD